MCRFSKIERGLNHSARSTVRVVYPSTAPLQAGSSKNTRILTLPFRHVSWEDITAGGGGRPRKSTVLRGAGGDITPVSLFLDFFAVRARSSRA